MSKAFILGYDPGGDDHHGMAILEISKTEKKWRVTGIKVTIVHCLDDTITWVKNNTFGHPILALGLDTFTEWNSGPKGWRTADIWLREKYPNYIKSIGAPNSLFGAMSVNGAAFLFVHQQRFQQDGTQITEAHPKVCYYALTNNLHAWETDQSTMKTWLLTELGLNYPVSILGVADHGFDAAISALAALRGLNQDWTMDLHALPQHPLVGNSVKFSGETHYWWPNAPNA